MLAPSRRRVREVLLRRVRRDLFSRDPDDPSQMAVRLGVFDTDPGVRPTWRQFVAYAATWEPIPDDGIERFAESSRGQA